METRKMNQERNNIQSGSAAVILFTTLSAAAAVATALLPFLASY
jgi:hypothetical protein